MSQNPAVAMVMITSPQNFQKPYDLFVDMLSSLMNMNFDVHGTAPPLSGLPACRYPEIQLSTPTNMITDYPMLSLSWAVTDD
jgi:hypothetical protein